MPESNPCQEEKWRMLGLESGMLSTSVSPHLQETETRQVYRSLSSGGGSQQPAASSQSKPTGSGAAEPGLQSLLGRKARLPQTPHTSSRMIQFNFHKVHENKGLRTSRGLLNNPSLVSPHRSLRVFNIHPANQVAFPRGLGESGGQQPCRGRGARKPCELSFGLPGFLSGI